jgi:hypothetical protein
VDDNGPSTASLHEAETRFQRVLLANDVAAFDHFLHPNVRFTGPDGVTIDKTADMESHRSQALTLTVVDELRREVQVIDGVGITRATLHLVGAAGEQEIDTVLAYTRTWLSSKGRWLVIAAHAGLGASSQTG